MSYEFISVRYVSLDFVPIEETEKLEKKLKDLLGRVTCPEGIFIAYPNSVSIFNWGYYDSKEFAEIIRRVLEKRLKKDEEIPSLKDRISDVLLLEELVSKIAIESYELEWPPIYLVSISAWINQENLNKMQTKPPKKFEKLAEILKIFMEEAISGMASYSSVFYPGVPFIAKYDVRVDKEIIDGLLNQTQLLQNMLTENITIDELLGISNYIRGTRILKSTIIKPEEDLISISPSASNLIHIVGQRTKTIDEFPEFRNIYIVTMTSQRDLVEVHNDFELDLFPVTSMIGPFVDLFDLGRYSYGMAVLFWLKYLEITISSTTEEQDQSLSLIKRIPLDVSIEKMHEISSKITTKAITNLNFIEKFHTMKKRIEREFERVVEQKSLIPTQQVVLPQVTDRYIAAFQFDFLNRYQEGIYGMLSKEILNMFEKIEVALEVQRGDFEYMVDLTSTKTSLRTDREVHRLTNSLTILTRILVILTVVLVFLTVILLIFELI